MPTPNIELLDKVMEVVFEEAAKDPSESLYNQLNWAEERDCGTAFCVAGWTLHLSGYKVLRYGYTPLWERPDGSTTAWTGIEAQVLLGLDDDERWVLFDCTSDLLEVEHTYELIRKRAEQEA